MVNKMATLAQINAFIDLFAPIVIVKCKEHGWGVPSAIIAQAGKESNWGLSGLSSTCFNYWGMKWREGCGCGYKEYKTKEQRTDGSYYEIVAKFRKYDNVEDGIEGYFKFIESYKRYVPVMQSKDYNSYAKQIKNCGWATSITYAESLIKYVRQYGLDKYDSIKEIPKAEVKYGYEIGRTYILLSNMYIRIAPNGDHVDYLSMTTNAQLNGYTDDNGYSVLKEGTKITCKDVTKIDNDIWMRIPSGWVCALKDNKIYIS